MRRYLFLFFVPLGFALAFILNGCAGQGKQAPIKWDLQSQASESSVDFQELKVFAEKVKVMSGGRLDITPYSGGKIAGGPDIFAAVSEGRVAMGNGWPNWWSGQHPAWAVMNSGPFDFMNLDASMMFFLEGNGTRLANELSVPHGVIWRPAWWPGMEFGLLSKQPITGLDDLKGMKIRIGPGLPSEVLAEVSGAYTIPLVPEEIEPALRSGDIDAVEWTTAGGVLDLQLHDISPHALVPAIWQPSVVSDFLINAVAYEALTPDLKAILESAIRDYSLTTTMKAKIADFEALEELKDSGVTFSRWSQEDIERWRVAKDSILDRYKHRDDFSKKLIEEKRSFKEAYEKYYEYFGQYD